MKLFDRMASFGADAYLMKRSETVLPNLLMNATLQFHAFCHCTYRFDPDTSALKPRLSIHHTLALKESFYLFNPEGVNIVFSRLTTVSHSLCLMP